MKYLVTGGCGFIGSHITERLAGEGHEVIVYDDLSSGYEHNIASIAGSVRLVRADVRDAGALAEAAKGAVGVFHEAALVSVPDSVERPAECHEINVTGTLNVLLAARDLGVRRVVLASSAAAYGNEPTLPKREDMRPEPESPYALAKVAGEYYARVFASLYGLETVSLRYFNVYGPRQDPSSMYSGVISKFNDVLTAGGRPTVFGDGGQTRDFVFVRDVVEANLLAMRSEKAGRGEVFNVATGARTNLLDLLTALKAIHGSDVEPELASERAGDIRHSVADIARARDALGYEPGVAFEAGLRELVSFTGGG